jgi:hypothetical protein
VLTKLGFREIERTRAWSKPRQTEIDQIRYELPREQWQEHIA